MIPMIPYEQFLQDKMKVDEGAGVNIKSEDINSLLFDWQNAIVRWSLRKGRTLVGLDCGLGKGPIQLEWLKQISLECGQPVIMFCPPGVKIQFKYEAEKFGYDVNVVAENDDIINGINITNYERLIIRDTVGRFDQDDYLAQFADFEPIEIKRDENNIYYERFRFNPKLFGGIALDEASILKHYNSRTRGRLTNFAKDTPFRICATATPAPNDYMELINYADFLGIMNGKQMRAQFFIQDGNSSSKFRIKKPAWKPFWKFMAEWAIVARKPGDLGYSDEGYSLPKLHSFVHVVKDENVPDGHLIAVEAKSLSEQSRVKRLTVKERCEAVLEIYNQNPDDHHLIYCELNSEGELLNKLIPNSVEISGSHSEDEKEAALMAFARGEIQNLITKPKIGGFGLNFQAHCHRVISAHVDHSYEKPYQFIRRLWRYGQKNDVYYTVVATDTEGSILENQNRKEKQAAMMIDEMVKVMDIHELNSRKVKKSEMDYKTSEYSSEYWKVMLGDSAERLKELEDQSVGLVVTSVPFPGMYAYTDSDRDIGNYDNSAELCKHLGYVFSALLSKMMPGRVIDIHLAQGIAHINREGYIGMWDFRGPLIQMMQDCGYHWDGEWTIEKDPQTERARSNTLGLMQKTLMNDASHMRPSVADYVLRFYAPGENQEPVNALLSQKGINGGNYDAPSGWITMPMWINWASNVWYKWRKGMKWWEGIDVTNVCGARIGDKKNGFGTADGKGKDDEKHLCELQLDVIERLIALHSNPGDLVCDPFNGIGSTGFQALKMGRRYVGCELKESYYYTAIKNLQFAEAELSQKTIFDLMEGDQDELTRRHKRWISDRGINILDEATNWQNWQKLEDMNIEEIINEIQN